MKMDRRAAVALAFALLAACGQAGSDRSDAGDAARPGSGAPAAFAVCLSCHSVTPGRQAAGPSLAGVMGRKAGRLPGYPFSDALRNSGIVWNEQTLDTWLQGPIRMVPGTRMVYPVTDPDARNAVIEYLKTLN